MRGSTVGFRFDILVKVRVGMVGGDLTSGGSPLTHDLPGHFVALEGVAVGIEHLHGDALDVGVVDFDLAGTGVTSDSGIDRVDPTVAHDVALGPDHGLIGIDIGGFPQLGGAIPPELIPIKRLERVAVLRVVLVVGHRVDDTGSPC